MIKDTSSLDLIGLDLHKFQTRGGGNDFSLCKFCEWFVPYGHGKFAQDEEMNII